MTNITKLEQALKFAKDLNLNDEQVRDLVAMIFGLIKPTIFPSIPWAQTIPFVPDSTTYTPFTVTWGGLANPSGGFTFNAPGMFPIGT